MQFGLSLPPFGDFADVRFLAETAQLAEAHGWDGFFIWDHAVYTPHYELIATPSVALTAIVLATSHIKTGAMVMALARRRPQIVAHEMMNLQQLSQGRIVLGAALGSEPDYDIFGEVSDAKIRAEKLDEALDVLQGLWSGEAFSYTGKHFQVDNITQKIPPAPHNRVPVWIGGGWDKKRPARRAARHDGFFPHKWLDRISIGEWRNIMAYVNQYRAENTPYDWIHSDASPGDKPEEAASLAQSYADIGVTWWIENVNPYRFGWSQDDTWNTEMTEQILERIRQKPPRTA